MSFPLNLYGLALLSGVMTTLLTLPLWRAWCRRQGLVDDPGRRKIHHQPIPLAGGLAVLTGLLLPLLGGWLALQAGLFEAGTTEHVTNALGPRARELAAILGGAIGMTLLGWLDDRHELRPTIKFAGQLLIATMVTAAGVRITLFVPSVLFSYAISILWLLTVINAFNFMDNMNGLCAGLGAIAALVIAGAAARQDQFLVAAFACLVGGAALGFLPFNFPRASAFLGDAGSHLLGYLLAILAILPHFYSARHPQAWAVLSPLLILALPLLDLARVVLVRWRLRQPFYIGDNNHLSHRLVRAGLSPTSAVALIWTAAAGIGLLVFLL